jgi:hypothetical protein
VIHAHKTAALIVAAVLCGAQLGAESVIREIVLFVKWLQGTGFPRTLPSAVTSTIDHPLGSPSMLVKRDT